MYTAGDARGRKMSNLGKGSCITSDGSHIQPSDPKQTPSGGELVGDLQCVTTHSGYIFLGSFEEIRMRSDKVFEALHTVRNRYMLCQLASKATRKFHKPNTRIQETTNDVLNRIADSERTTVMAEPLNASEAQRRAA